MNELVGCKIYAQDEGLTAKDKREEFCNEYTIVGANFSTSTGESLLLYKSYGLSRFDSGQSSIFVVAEMTVNTFSVRLEALVLNHGQSFGREMLILEDAVKILISGDQTRCFV